MPTAPDAQVFIQWKRIEYTQNSTGDGFDVKVDVEVNVAGVRIASVVYYSIVNTDDRTAMLVDALDTKREQFVSA
jgi:hypothetical protein